MKNQTSSYVEIKTVTWSKDSHGLFDYESKNVNFTKNKIEASSKIYKFGNDISVRANSDSDNMLLEDSESKQNYLFSVQSEADKQEKFFLKIDDNQKIENVDMNHLFLIVRSLKNEDGNQKGYPLEIGDIVRLGRIEYRVIEYQNHSSEIFSLLRGSTVNKNVPFGLGVKNCNDFDKIHKRQCRICLMDEHDSVGVIVNPCSCKGTSEFVHIACLQDWISSKVKKKINPTATCFYWKKLNCEVCKVPLPDLVQVNKELLELIPIYRPETPYILLERVFYDKTKETGDNSKMMILLSVSADNQIKLGRGHECDLRENDISVSRLHAFIKYENGQFIVFDNNSKFGTLVLLRKNYKIEKKKIALQIGRTVLTFSLKQSAVQNVPVFKNPMLMEKFGKYVSPKNGLPESQSKPVVSQSNRHHKNVATPAVSTTSNNNNNDQEKGPNNDSFLE
jgi:hypothetical protein